MTGDGAAAQFRQLARLTLDELLERDPETATSLGDHRYDHRLNDRREDALDEQRRWAGRRLADIDAVDTAQLPASVRVDARILRNQLAARIFALDELREHTWNPLLANPGSAVYALLARDYAPLAQRLRAVASRLDAVSPALDVARHSLGDMPRVHVETAISQFTGTRTLLITQLEQALDDEPALRREVESSRALALEAIEEHISWLRAKLPDAAGDPRLGPERLAAKLSLKLETSSDVDGVLTRAEHDLAVMEERLAQTAARLDRAPAATHQERVRRVLDRLADEAWVDDDTVVGLCEQALAETTEFVRGHDLVTVYDDPVEIIVMPEIHRGVAVAYCDPPGPLEAGSLPTYFAISPTPAEWPPERVRSFFREYNAHMLHNLTVHEAMPGHVLQLSHSRRFASVTPVRKAFWNGPFVEGWAVYAEELMVEHGYRAGSGARSPEAADAADAADALRMHQLKMQLRMTINAILDARVHAHGMTEEEAMRLMMDRGHQEESEAAGKWRRALLTSAQLSTYYVGYVEVADVAHAGRAAHPEWSLRQLHDAMLAHGSPAPRHLRTLLAL